MLWYLRLFPLFHWGYDRMVVPPQLQILHIYYMNRMNCFTIITIRNALVYLNVHVCTNICLTPFNYNENLFFPLTIVSSILRPTSLIRLLWYRERAELEVFKNFLIPFNISNKVLSGVLTRLIGIMSKNRLFLIRLKDQRPMK